MQASSLFSALFVFLSFISKGQEITDSTSLLKYINDHAEEYGISKKVLNDPKYRLQMVFTETDLSDTTFNSIGFGTHNYYYPASLVKFPVALLALEKMKRLGITMKDYISISEDGCGNHNRVYRNKGKMILFETLFEELMVVSDNQFYTVLYQFMTPEEINEELKKKGFSGTHIYKSFAGCEREDQLKCYPITVYNPALEVIHEQTYCDLDTNEMLVNYQFTEKRLFGSKHEDEFGDIVPGPYDLNYSIEIPLDEINEMLVRFEHPELFEKSEQWNIRTKDAAELNTMMMAFPNEMNHPKKYADNKYKFAEIDFSDYSHRNSSKIGLSYGFTSEVLHYVNVKEKVDFFLSVSLYTNANDIVNDGDYEYETVARPFIASLYKLLYAYELSNVEKK